MKPYRMALIGFYTSLLIAAFLGGVYFLQQKKILPQEVWYISPDSSLSLRLPTFLTTQNTAKKVDISQIKKRFTIKNDETKTFETQKNTENSASALLSGTLNPEKIADSIAISVRIQYAEENKKSLHSFFRALQSLEAGESQLYRVLHYGDSQLEGDRITSFLRDRLQERFGGCGAGMQAIGNPNNIKFTILQEFDPAWKQRILFGKEANSNTDYFGILGSYSGWKKPDTSAKTVFSKSAKAHYKNQQAENIKILYRNPEHTFHIMLKEENNVFFNEEIEISKTFNLTTIPLQQGFERIECSFWGSWQSPELYGISLDCNKGITCDNIPLRGSSGLEFHKMEEKHLQKQYKDLQVRLIVLQFGVNVNLNDKDYNYYEQKFYKELLYLKKLAPQASFLVIGISDRSYKRGEEYISYAGIPQLRDAQRRAAFRAGCAFWDLYEAMGGKNSMPAWVREGLGGKDFTHFKVEGAALVGNMLVESLLKEYELYKSRGL